MIGAFIGDIAGSYYSAHPTLNRRLTLFREGSAFTQGSVFMAAHCEHLYYAVTPAEGWGERRVRARELAAELKKYAARYPECLNESEKRWTQTALMKKSPTADLYAAAAALPCAYICENERQAAEQAELCCAYLFNESDSRLAAKAAAVSVNMLFRGEDPEGARRRCEELCGMEIACDHEQLRDEGEAKLSAQSIMSAAYASLFGANDFVGAVKNACCCGADAAITAAVTGAMAQAYYKEIPEEVKSQALPLLDSMLLKQLQRFCGKFFE